MKLKNWLAKFGLNKLKFKLSFLEAEWDLSSPDRDAAWDLYVELLTRVTTQRLPQGIGDESSALKSVHNIFPITRDILKSRGRGAEKFARIAVVILNQVVRPFTSKWHKPSIDGSLSAPECSIAFRQDLSALQDELSRFMVALADMAEVEDMTDWQTEDVKP